jgi:hypothetical protein
MTLCLIVRSFPARAVNRCIWERKLPSREEAERILMSVYAGLILRPRQPDGSWAATVIQGNRYAIVLREKPGGNCPLWLDVIDVNSTASIDSAGFLDVEEGIMPLLAMLPAVKLDTP